jgi:hypothetical protein
VLVNFMCQLGWARVYRSNLILDVSVRVFLDEISIYIGEL